MRQERQSGWHGEFAAGMRAFCARVRGIRQIRSQEMRTLHTCSRNTTNSQPGGAYFEHMFEKYAEFAARRRVLCTRVREIRRIRSHEARTLHTSFRLQRRVVPVWAKSGRKVALCQLQLCIKRTAHKPAVLASRTSVWLVRRICSRDARTLRTCTRNTANSQPGGAYFAHVFEKYDEFTTGRRVL